MNPKKVVIAVSMDKKDQKPLEKLKGSSWIEDAEVHLVHVFESVSYSVELSSFFFPLESEYPRIRKDVETELNKIQKKLFPKTGRNKIIIKCIIADETKESFAKYSRSIKADLLVVATRGKKGLKGFFDSSFARYMSKYLPTDLLILRP